ncbi:MAG TPA: SOS response-associated peptidase family protein [Methylibium sp.]|uniref:SOS response-associated peptidase family protein n=1 Tax=Methylibium sp. TaxID=2067992 RepID=UPI002DBA02B7|nr:SOS response-associated peptidase family protein [Methylibium sp.]HEU4459988.1 SOS response-associated peptidase family protein [Methylibium sp.]
MCYSAQIWSAWRKFERAFKSGISLHDFAELYGFRMADKRIKIPKAMDFAFADPQTDDERAIKALIDEFNRQQTTELEQALFVQRKRLADAERSLQTKLTKAATESRRIATDKIDWQLGKLADLKRTEPKDSDSRIFPGWYAPVLVMEEGQRVIKPMRYQCRLAGKPAFYDTKYPGTYNARRDNLGGFWKSLFGVSHGVMVVSRFFENVQRTEPDGTTKNLVLEFSPHDGREMLVACLWSRWTAPGEPDLLSFAAITDEPPEEVAAAGHDRCIVPIKAEHIDAWLKLDPNDLATLYAILDDRERPYYEHRMAA